GQRSHALAIGRPDQLKRSIEGENAITTTTIDPNSVPSPYPGRTELLPWSRDAVGAEWLTKLVENKYPGVVAEKLEEVQLFDSHTTKLRIAVDWNAAG